MDTKNNWEYTKTKLKQADIEIWKKYGNQPDPDPLTQKQINDQLDRIPDMMLQTDLASILLDNISKSDDIVNEITTKYIDVEPDECTRQKFSNIILSATKDANIRNDFATALRNVKKGTELSFPLGFGFSKRDLIELCRLHKSNKFRKKIEDLLEDCNFHTECGWLAAKEYDRILQTAK